MGAWAADPTRPVIAVTGDGGFGQYLAEVTTAVKYGIPIKHVLLDNGMLGKIGKEQRAGQFPEWQVSLVNPDFAAYAELCGARARTVRTRAELEDGMAEMVAADGPFLLHVAAGQRAGVGRDAPPRWSSCSPSRRPSRSLRGLVPRLPLPGPLLELLAGIALGPTGFGWVHVDPLVSAVAVLGMAFLLFLAGFEVDVRGLAGPDGRVAGRGLLVSAGPGRRWPRACCSRSGGRSRPPCSSRRP